MNHYFISVPLGTRYIKLGYIAGEEMDVDYIDVHFIETDLYWGITCIIDEKSNVLTHSILESGSIKSNIDIDDKSFSITVIRLEGEYVIELKEIN